MITRARRSKGEHGAALLEFVLVIPLFLYVLYAMVGFGLSLSLKEDITHASAEGARAAIGAQVSTTYTTPLAAQEAAATTRITNILGWLGSNEAYVSISFNP